VIWFGAFELAQQPVAALYRGVERGLRGVEVDGAARAKAVRLGTDAEFVAADDLTNAVVAAARAPAA